MRRWAVVLLIAGCYAPHAVTGSPCALDTDCPREQRCLARACELPGATAPDDAAADTEVPVDAAPWSAAIALRGVNTGAVEDDPSVTPDGLTLVFVSTRDGSPDIFLGTRGKLDEAFSVAPLAALNTGGDESSPELTADGKTIYFSTDRVTAGSPDIFVSHLQGTTWSMPVVVPELTSPKVESDLAISPDGLTAVVARADQLLLATRATTSDAFGALTALPGFAGSPAAPTITNHADTIYFHAGDVRDLYVTYRTGASFTTPIPVTELNTAGRDDGPFLSADGHHLYFARDNDLYEATR